MPLTSAVVGSTSRPFHHTADLRWILAYSAGIHDEARSVFSQHAVAHPVFPVCLEWPAILDLRVHGLTREEAGRGVHASHDLTIHRPVRPGDELVTTATTVGVEAGRNGAATWTRLSTVDAQGRPVATTYQRGVLLGVPLDGEGLIVDRPSPWDPPSVDDAGSVERTIEVGAQDAHTYTECARIWNPIHTEWDVASAAGLPFLLLHGTATLARAVSVVDDLIGSGQREVDRIACRFAAPVPMPSALTIRAWPDGRFQVALPDGSAVITGGRLRWRTASS